MHTLKRILPKINLEKDEVPGEVLDSLKVERGDFIEAMKMFKVRTFVMVFVP